MDTRKVDHVVAQAIVAYVESDCHHGLAWGTTSPDLIKKKLSAESDKYGYVQVSPFFQWLNDQETCKMISFANDNLKKIRHFIARAAVK